MRLIDLNPHWFAEEGRHGQGVTFDCPHCVGQPRGYRLAVAFAAPLDGGAPIDLNQQGPLFRAIQLGSTMTVPPGVHWQRNGDTFETLTLWPSVDCSGAGHWHGFLVNGGVQ